MHRRAATLPVALMTLGPLLTMPSAEAQIPAGPEFRVGGTSANSPSVSFTVDGSFVVTWSEPDGSQLGVFAQRHDASGAPQGPAFRVNAHTTGHQWLSRVASDAVGSFVVVWEGISSAGEGVLGRRYDASATPRGAEFRVNTNTTLVNYLASVAMDPAGNFVVAWSSGPEFCYSVYVYCKDIVAQRYDASGTPRGGEFRVNTGTAGPREDSSPSVAADAAGNFVVAWHSWYPAGPPNSPSMIFGRRYDASGVAQGAEFPISTYTTSLDSGPSVGVDPGGDFVVAWRSATRGILARRFDSSGIPQGAEVRVSTNTASFPIPSVSVAEAGKFVVAWQGQDGDLTGVFAKRFDAFGVPRGAEFLVNTYTTGRQQRPNLATDPVGNFVVTWYGSVVAPGAFGQRFGGLVPELLAVDTTANAVLEPGETVDVRPSWRNVNGAAQTFSATLDGISGPAGGVYSITDSTGDYGTVADGAIAPCTDCFAVSVSNPAMRPATHWDASAIESIAPDTHGQQKRWRLHIGASFDDVPATSGFYRFVETVLHHGVTAGCGAEQYCPLASTTREQMAVFVLVAKEGSGYVPPACTTAVFPDVLPSSPFCPWIEELARRGVVSGCGAGNYCPTAPVTREQMAVLVLRALDPTLSPPACTTPVFNDVPISSPFCRWVEELARRGVVTGCGGGNYCPSSPVPRDQMSVFLAITFGLALYGP